MTDSDSTVASIGRGGFGVVYRATNQLGLQRAIKIPDWTALGYLFSSGETGTEPILREIALATQFPYTHVIPILEFHHECRDASGKEFMFYVMPFVDGLTIDIFFSRLLEKHRSAIRNQPFLRGYIKDLFLSLLDEVLIGLTELFHSNTVHMDISVRNIMVAMFGATPDSPLPELLSKCHAFIIDLGAAKHITSLRTDRAPFIHNREFFPRWLTPRLVAIDDENAMYLEYDRLKDYWSVIDPACLAESLAVILGRPRDGPLDPATIEEWQLILGDDCDFILEIVCKARDGPEPLFTDSPSMRDAFDTIRRPHAGGIADSMVLTDRERPIRIRSGNQIVKAAAPLSEVIEHPVFQRLRRLQQLSFLTEVFPGAGHNRFAHSLQTLSLVKRYLWSLSRVNDFRAVFRKEHVDEVLVASLLHNVGQYPFAHAIEDLKRLGDRTAEIAIQARIDPAERQRRLEAVASLIAIRPHEELAPIWLDRCEDTLLGKVSIADILKNRYDIRVKNLVYLIGKEPKNQNKEAHLNIGKDLIDGLISGGRVSQLSYDSQQTGAAYGNAVDLGSLIEGLTIRPLPVPALAVEEGAVASVEAVVAAMYWMYRNVYWHHANRALTAAIRLVVRRLLQEGQLSFLNYVESTYGRSDLESLQLLKVMYDQFLAKSGVSSTNPLESVLSFRRMGYKRIYSLSYLHSFQIRDPEDHVANSLYERLVRGLTVDRLDQLVKELRRIAFGAKAIRDGELLVDVPFEPQPREEETSIWVRRRTPGTKTTRGWIPIEIYSPLVTALQDRSARKIRIYVSQDWYHSLSGQRQEKAPEFFHEALKALTQDW